ncbi:MAG: WS/DGAT domain-containing protein [Deltaproteobacteria bacterium]
MKITAHLKNTDQALAVRLMMRMIEFGPTSMLSLAARAQDGLADTFVTNIPGPQFPLYLFGARMKAMLPQVPLLRGMALAIGLMSYDGNVCWGLTADSKLVPDLPQFREALIESYEEICTAQGVELDRDALASRTWR